jgi:hypothetical protein
MSDLLEQLKDNLVAIVVVAVVLSLCCCGSLAAFFGEDDPEVIADNTQPEATEPVESKKAEQEPSQQAAEKALAEKPDQRSEDPEEPESEPSEQRWVESKWVRFEPDEDCPTDWWAILPGDAPGEDEFEQKANAKKRDELEKKVMEQTYVVELPVEDLTLSDYDFDEGAFTVEVPTLLWCSTDRTIWVALGEPSVKPTYTNHRQTGNRIQVSREWESEPFAFTMPMSEEEAKEFRRIWDSADNALLDEPRDDFEILMAFTIDRVRVDERKKRPDDYPLAVGAGPVVDADRKHVRIVHKDMEWLDTKEEASD